MYDTREPQFHAFKRILKYIRGTFDYEFQLHVSTTYSLISYSYVDWGGFPASRRSTSGFVFILGTTLSLLHPNGMPQFPAPV